MDRSRLWFAGRFYDPTLGEAILSSFDDYRASQGGTLLPSIYTLLGDPAIPLK